MTYAEVERRGPGRPRKIVETSELDEAGPIVRYTPAMIDDWMLSRLNERWPGFHPITWRSKFASFAGSNDHLLVTNEAAVLLATLGKHQMTMRPVVSEIFCFVREAEKDKKYTENWVVQHGSVGQLSALALYRHMRQWAESMLAVRFIIGLCSDLTPGTLRERFRGDYLVDVLL